MTERDHTAVVQRAYRLRARPNATQRRQLAIEFGCARFCWNAALDARQSVYRWYGQSVSGIDLGKAITEVKADSDFAWLRDATTACCTQALRDQDTAFVNFFAGRGRYPRFKKKSDRQSIRYQLDGRKLMCVPGKWLRLPKLGRIKTRWSRIPSGVPKMVTVSLSPAGEYHVSFMVEEAIEQWSMPDHVVGVDVGIKDVAVTSDGWHSGAPRATYRLARKLRHEQRALSRKKKGSRRRARQVKKVAKVHGQIANARKDFLHKTSTAIVKSASVVCVEDLNVAGMLKNRCLAKAVADAGMGELRRQLAYKCAWHGRDLVVVDRWMPTTKACSGCGQLHDMPLSKRRMKCDCGVDIDRDVNAAINIRRAAGVSSGSFGSERVEGDTFCSARAPAGAASDEACRSGNPEHDGHDGRRAQG